MTNTEVIHVHFMYNVELFNVNGYIGWTTWIQINGEYIMRAAGVRIM